MVDEKIAKKILKTYGNAWVNQDIYMILSIFHKDGIYHERIFEKPFKGHSQIGTYWKSKVVEEQSNIKFKLLNYYICDDMIIAEWDASFYSNIEKARIHIREVAIIKVKGNKIESLREYWQSERI